MALITMNTDKVKEMCDSAIEYYEYHQAGILENELKVQEYLDKFSILRTLLPDPLDLGREIKTLKNIKALAETSDGVIWISDSDMELMSKKLGEKPISDEPNEKLYRLSISKVRAVRDPRIKNFNVGLEIVLKNWFEKDIKESDKGTLCAMFGVPTDCFEEIA